MRQDYKTLNLVLKPVHLVLFFSVFQLLIAWLTDSLAFTQEESMWHYIGRNWLRHGLTPYAGGVDNKSPLIFSIFGLSDWLFGVNYWFPRLLGTMVQSAGIFYAFKIASHLAGKQAGLLAIVLYGCSLMWRSTGGKYVSFTETYAVLFILMAFYYALTATKQKGFFLSGLLAGIGLGFRFSTGFGILALVVILFRINKLAPLLFLAGTIASAALLLGLIWLTGINLGDLIHYSFTDNFGTGSVTDRTWAWKLESFGNAFFYSELILFYPFVLAFYFTSTKKFILTTWLVFELAGIVTLGIFARNHLKHILPVFSIMSAISLAWLVEKYRVPFKAILIIIFIAFFPKTWEPLFGLKKLIFGSKTNPGQFCQPPYPQPDEHSKKKLGLWIKANTLQSEVVYIAGSGSTIQAYSERLSPTIYFNATQTKGAKDLLFQDLISNKPTWILIPQFAEYERHIHKDSRDFIYDLVSEYYQFVQCTAGYSIYRRK